MTYRALLIANSTFPADDNNLVPLEGPRNDPLLLRDALCDREVGMVASEHVRIVAERTMAEVLLEIEEFLLTAARDDTVILYYSGHGLLDLGNELYLAVRDTRTDRLRATAVKAADISRMLDDSSAAAAVVVLDCCHSGRFKGGADLPAALAGRGRFVLTASRPGQLAADTDARNRASVFTHHLVEGLYHGAQDRDGDGYVGISDLYDYVHRSMVAAGRQIPHKRFEGNGDVPIARRTSVAVDPAVATPPEPVPTVTRRRSPEKLATPLAEPNARAALTAWAADGAFPGAPFLGLLAGWVLSATAVDASHSVSEFSVGTTAAILRHTDSGPGLLFSLLGAGGLALTSVAGCRRVWARPALAATSVLMVMLAIERLGWVARSRAWCNGCLYSGDVMAGDLRGGGEFVLVTGVAALGLLLLGTRIRRRPGRRSISWGWAFTTAVTTGLAVAAHRLPPFLLDHTLIGADPNDGWYATWAVAMMFAATASAAVNSPSGGAALAAVGGLVALDGLTEITFLVANRNLAGLSGWNLAPKLLAELLMVRMAATRVMEQIDAGRTPRSRGSA